MKPSTRILTVYCIVLLAFFSCKKDLIPNDEPQFAIPDTAYATYYDITNVFYDVEATYIENTDSVYVMTEPIDMLLNVHPGITIKVADYPSLRDSSGTLLLNYYNSVSIKYLGGHRNLEPFMEDGNPPVPVAIRDPCAPYTITVYTDTVYQIDSFANSYAIFEVSDSLTTVIDTIWYAQDPNFIWDIYGLDLPQFQNGAGGWIGWADWADWNGRYYDYENEFVPALNKISGKPIFNDFPLSVYLLDILPYSQPTFQDAYLTYYVIVPTI